MQVYLVNTRIDRLVIAKFLNTEMLGFLGQRPPDRHFIHLILNDENLESAPNNIALVGRTLTYTRHPHLGWTMTIGDRPQKMTDFIVTMIAKITRARYIRVKTFDEAVEHLKQVDQSIDWAKAPTISTT